MAEKKDPSKSPRETGGPVVKTGPTRGENRSRNDDGRWREKRSDAGSERKKKSGCYITTAACKLMSLPDNCREVTCLRNYRDTKLLRSAVGRRLVAHYYRIAPDIASALNRRQLRQVWSSIQNCVRAIEAERYSRALLTYRLMVRRLGK